MHRLSSNVSRGESSLIIHIGTSGRDLNKQELTSLRRSSVCGHDTVIKLGEPLRTTTVQYMAEAYKVSVRGREPTIYYQSAQL